MTENLLQLLREEHRHALALMDQIEETIDAVQRKELYLKLKSELMGHMIGEEKTLYIHLAEDVDRDSAEELADNATQEHIHLKELLGQLDNLGIENPEWEMLFQKLKEQFLDHVELEEAVLFREAKEDFSREELANFADQFQELKLLDN